MKKWIKRCMYFLFVLMALLILQLFLFSFFPALIVMSENLWEFNTASDYMNTACVAASALFTACAFGATFWAIMQQRKEVQQQKENTLRVTTLNVFTRTFNELLNNLDFINAQEYVLYNLEKDIEKIKKQSYGSNTQIGTREIMNFSAKKYKLLMYFLTKMDYIGIIVKKEYIDEIILDYYGKIILDSYAKLEELIHSDIKRGLGNTYFIHFRMLYDKTKARKPIFEKECDNYIDQGMTIYDN